MDIIELKEEEAYRIQDPIDSVIVTLLDGAVEIFGEELLIVFIRRSLEKII